MFHNVRVYSNLFIFTHILNDAATRFFKWISGFFYDVNAPTIPAAPSLDALQGKGRKANTEHTSHRKIVSFEAANDDCCKNS